MSTKQRYVDEELVVRRITAIDGVNAPNIDETITQINKALTFVQQVKSDTKDIIDQSNLDSKNIFAADEAEDTEQLFDQFYVDKAELLENIRLALIGEKQLTLGGVLAKHPLTRGLAEVVTYLSLAANSDFAMIDDSHEEEKSWSTAAGRVRKCRLPRVIFLKKAAAGGAVHE